MAHLSLSPLLSCSRSSFGLTLSRSVPGQKQDANVGMNANDDSADEGLSGGELRQRR